MDFPNGRGWARRGVRAREADAAPGVQAHEAFHLPTWFGRNLEGRLAERVGGLARLRVVTLLACVLALSSADGATVGAVALPLEHSLGVGAVRLGLLVTVTTAVAALATLPFGVLVDRVSRVRLLVASVAVWSVAQAASGLAPSYGVLLATRLALGAVVAVAGPAVASLTGDFFLPGERAQIYGYLVAGELVGAGLGILVSGDLAGILSWRISFFALGAAGTALALALARGLTEPLRGGQSRLFPEPGPAEPGPAEPGPGRPLGTTVEPAPEGDGAWGAAPRSGSVPPPSVPGDPDGALAHGGAASEAAVSSELVREVRAAHVRPRAELVLRDDPRGMSLWAATRYILRIPTNVVLVVASALGYFFFSGLETFGIELLRARFGLDQVEATTVFLLVATGALAGVLWSGRLADRLIGAGRIAARPGVTGIAFLAAALLLAPGFAVAAPALALPLLFLGGIAYGGTNPPLDAARLDVVHHLLWGRAEAVRTVARTLLVAAAPLVFGIVAASFGGSDQGLAANGRGQSGAALTAAAARGLDRTFLVMLLPLAAAGLLLVLVARRTYPRDLATAIASEQRSRRGQLRRGRSDGRS